MIAMCRICGYSGNSVAYTVQEMMLGTGDAFVYFQCGRCNCLQIAEFPQNLSRYYPADYYSFSSSSRDRTNNPFVQWLRRLRNRSSVLDSGIQSRLIRLLAPNRKLLPLLTLDLSPDSRILDVGCGSGWRLYALRETGFINTMGVDPYIEEEITYQNGLRILKRTIGEVEGNWDVIMFHHSLEHIPDQQQTLRQAAGRLRPGGTCLIRLPTVSSYAWEHYRENWYQIDAPRHFYLHSLESMRHLAKQCGMVIQSVVYDSTVDQFRASEQYRRKSKSEKETEFSRAQIRAWKQQAARLNRDNRGDQAAFFLRATESIR
jgi:2-polyprenyl-3-methyl-5-hydroxy-6-metoxy-1,4-benzoquinol methylase